MKRETVIKHLRELGYFKDAKMFDPKFDGAVIGSTAEKVIYHYSLLWKIADESGMSGIQAYEYIDKYIAKMNREYGDEAPLVMYAIDAL